MLAYGIFLALKDIQRETPKRKKGELYSYHQKLEVSTKSKKYEAVQGLAA